MAKKKKFKSYVTFFDNKTGKFVKYYPGDTPTKEHAEQITNEACYEDSKDDDSPEESAPMPAEQSASDLEEMAYNDLVKLAKDKEIKFDKNPSKAEVIEALLDLEKD